jgi:hypothetical protein
MNEAHPTRFYQPCDLCPTLRSTRPAHASGSCGRRERVTFGVQCPLFEYLTGCKGSGSAHDPRCKLDLPSIERRLS